MWLTECCFVVVMWVVIVVSVVDGGGGIRTLRLNLKSNISLSLTIISALGHGV